MHPIEARDLSAPRQLTRAFFRATNPHLDPARFEAKWAKAFESPLRFFRAFPQAWYLDLTQVPAAHMPGRTDWCFGDLHPENFGFLVVGDQVHYAFNDLDDSGPAEVGLDALRYFTAHLLWTGDERATDALIDLYRDVMRTPARAPQLPAEFIPAAEAVRARQRGKFVAGGKLVRDDDTRLGAVATSDRELVTRALKANGFSVRDVAEREREHGGSGGLRRFWALVRRDGVTDVLEVKELTRPATAWGHATSPIDDRIAKVRDAVWPGLGVSDHFTVALGTSEYVVRSRLSRATLRLEKLDEEALETVLEVQVGVMARHHRRAFRPIELQALDEWLQDSVRVTAARWLEVFERLR
ncbi:MAG: DUF2252 family protein [Myxococcaceae bacterium]|jgi:hypothetical protein|nr:DUF2252 family protein [Myxococcaceae bacterium]